MATKRTIGFLTMSLLLGSAAMPVLAQDTPPAGQPGQPGQGGRPDPAQFRQRFMDRIKEQLGSSDDEFKVLQPKIEQLFEIQRQSRGGGMGFGGGGGRRGGPNGGAPDPNAAPTPTTPTQEKVKDLQATLDNKDSKPDEIKAKLAALRDARAKAKEELNKAQAELRDLLTQRQEAALVMMGLLD